MIKLIRAENLGSHQLRLYFSDGARGEFDFNEIVETRTAMTAPLGDEGFFSRYFIELGALAWPNGFDMSAGSLHRRLSATGALHRDADAA